jgi:hypothetical protein
MGRAPQVVPLGVLRARARARTGVRAEHRKRDTYAARARRTADGARETREQV